MQKSLVFISKSCISFSRFCASFSNNDRVCSVLSLAFHFKKVLDRGHTGKYLFFFIIFLSGYYDHKVRAGLCSGTERRRLGFVFLASSSV